MERPATTRTTRPRSVPRKIRVPSNVGTVTLSPVKIAFARILARSAGESVEISAAALATVHISVTLTSGRRMLVVTTVIPLAAPSGAQGLIQRLTSVSMLSMTSRVVSPDPLPFTADVERDIHHADGHANW